ncbi:MAG: thiamine phosphate synthase [Bryobacterales bacterium]|nr:thiamine phosphate synthase [Bryobacterales bacterium]
MPFDLPAFYPILDTEIAARYGVDVTFAAREILAGGARILQFRHKGFFSRDVFAAMERVAAVCRDAGVPFVVNDRADLAVLTNAVLHLGQEDLPPAAARKITGPDTIIGYSTHNETQLRAAVAEGVADYLALGPIFGTASKENPDPTVGLAELKRLRPLANRPLVAIGGITRQNARAVLAAGADSVAVIGDLFADPGNLRGCVEDWIAVTRDAKNV